MTQKIKQIARLAINWVFWICVISVIFIFAQIFLVSSFKIPSDSMEPELITGDNIIVYKWIPGARLFNVFESLEGKQVEINRMPGIRKIRRNDVVVFNFPHPSTWDRIEMDIMKYYIKRCIGVPGDSVRIINGKYGITGVSTPLGNVESQERIGNRDMESFEPGVFRSFPFDSTLNWNIKHFGPLYIPKAGDSIILDNTNYLLYRKVIEWEQKAILERKATGYFMKNKEIDSYRFKNNYYFMAGDRSEDSQDSRYWGLLPEEYIVGKASFIWKSVDPYSGKIRWNRFMKIIR